MKLIKKSNVPNSGRPAGDGVLGAAIDRRTFLRRTGLVLGGGALATALQPTMMVRTAEAARVQSTGPVELKRSVCGHCSVGCGVIAEVQNGVWTGQEPDFDSPLNLGGHCAKGAAVREHGHGERRIKYPMKLVDGKWKRISWDDAVNEIGDQLLSIREKSGPDALFFAGSSKASNEGAYLQRKFMAFWGSNNIDHQARICHSTTVAGVANTWGYGAMTNSYNDMHRSKAMFFIGSNAAEAHPVSMQHILRAKENGSKMIVADPRFTRTAAHAHQHLRFRPGTDIPLIWGMLWHVFENGWEDKEYISQRVLGMEDIRAEVAKWTPDVVENVTGVPGDQLKRATQTMAENRPGTIVWCMGGTQHTVGNANVRAYCVLQLALGNIGKVGGGANIFRGHDNVQGATDVGPNCDTLPGYYGLADASWVHWARVWDVDIDYLKSRFDFSKMYLEGAAETYRMNTPGIAVSRWVDGILEDAENVQQSDSLKAVFFQGHAVNSQVRGVEMKKALEKVDLVVISDPFPTHMAVMSERKNNTYLLPTCTQFEQSGSITASNRSVQWREQVINPLFESKRDAEILYLFAQKFGFADQMFKNIKVENGMPSPEDTLREINRGAWTIGYSGISPERLKLHLENKATFNTTTLKAEGGPCDGETYGLPWPCWGTPEMKHPGTHVLYDPSLPVKDGGLSFRVNFGLEYRGETLLAENSWPVGSEIQDGYPAFTADMLKQLGWWDDLTDAEKAEAEGRAWHTDLSGGIIRVAIKHGCSPFGNGKARCIVWNFPDHVPIHREALYTPRFDLVEKYPSHDDRKAQWRLPTRFVGIQKAKDHSKQYPLVFTSGRLTEYEGGGEETRSNPWLAELQQEMFVEINAADANDRGIKDGQWVWLEGAEGGRIKIKAMVTPRVGRGVVWTPFHFGGWFQGKDLLDRYPEGTHPYVRGEACNTATTYGYDPVTSMQETKTTLCQISAA
jgi:formate dehydrogenase major subunit